MGIEIFLRVNRNKKVTVPIMNISADADLVGLSEIFFTCLYAVGQVFLARYVTYTSRAYATMSVSVCL